ncbi:hypothetical protein [Tardiphaga sp.]|uniref:hypothetical protein n=1 Tax=Tardiphaga sp. TaxID=1926292 RepID=UPI0037D9F9B7
MINVGAKWQDKGGVSDGGIVTSRNPGDLEALSKQIITEIREAAEARRRRGRLELLLRGLTRQSN